MRNRTSISWKGAIPAQAVVYLQIDDAKKTPARNATIGTHVRDYHWFSVRATKTYADFDARTATARLGMGGIDSGVAQIGSVIDHPTMRLRVQVNHKPIEKARRKFAAGNAH